MDFALAMGGDEANEGIAQDSEGRLQMRRFSLVLVLALGLAVLSDCIMYRPSGGPYGEPEGPYGRTYAYGARMDISYFYDYLSDYGYWVNYPPYGYVWVPYSLGRAWRPYSYGRWAWTDYGWTWVSYHRWGWIVFHYGRWAWEPGFGWFWVPDTVWGPAWVSWRYGGGWIGWAPLPPRYRFSRPHGLFLTSINLPDDYWVFVEGNHFDADDVNGYLAPSTRNGQLIRTTVFKAQLEDRDGRVVNNGLSLDEAEKITRRRFSTLTLQDAGQPEESRLGSDRVTMYRPEVSQKVTAVPRKVLSPEELDKQRAIRSTETEVTPSLSVRHREEITRLQSSQNEELKQTNKRYEEQLSRAASASERKRLEKERETRIKQLKVRHEQQLTKLKKKQAEEDKTKRGKKRDLA
jgi:hypothetical protein